MGRREERPEEVKQILLSLAGHPLAWRLFVSSFLCPHSSAKFLMPLKERVRGSPTSTGPHVNGYCKTKPISGRGHPAERPLGVEPARFCKT